MTCRCTCRVSEVQQGSHSLRVLHVADWGTVFHQSASVGCGLIHKHARTIDYLLLVYNHPVAGVGTYNDSIRCDVYPRLSGLAGEGEYHRAVAVPLEHI